jgi:magnesium transporter
MLVVDGPATSHAPQLPPFRDEDGEIEAAYVEAVERAVGERDFVTLSALVEDLHQSDVGDLLEALEHDTRPALIELLGSVFDFAALTEVDDTIRDEILHELETQTVAEGVRELDSDDAVTILGDLTPGETREILDRLPHLERVALQKALDYPEDAAGRLMQTEFIAAPRFWTVGQTIDFMRETENLPETFYEIYVVSAEGKLIGSVALDRLLRAQRPVKIGDIMRDGLHRVGAMEPQDEVARRFERYNLVAAAVVDEADRLVGVITIDDVVDVLEEEADADIKALGGVKADEEISDSVWYITRSRFLWLFINLVTAFIASGVLKGFEAELSEMVALAVLAPIVASQGGNAATQTMTVAVRALATRDLGPWNMWRVIGREVAAGLLNGVGFALITGLFAAIWFTSRDLGIVIGLAMIVNLLAAALAGILVPLTLERIGADPAVASGPFVTTVTDVVGFFSFLGIATLWFSL